MRTLVYYASGPFSSKYLDLGFDQIYLVDNCFRDIYHSSRRVFSKGKVTYLGMDCLESIDFLSREGVRIDCFVSLNEGLFEGGGIYPINSDMFIGYCMPILQYSYIHIMNKKYYCNMYDIHMDLPYKIEVIKSDDARYLDPFFFSKQDYNKDAKVLQMSKEFYRREIKVDSNIKLSIIHDSIWNYYSQLDLIVTTFKQQGQEDFFTRKPNVIDLTQANWYEVFYYCKRNRIKKVGFTSLPGKQNSTFIEDVKRLDGPYPREIMLFHLNKQYYFDDEFFVLKNNPF